MVLADWLSRSKVIVVVGSGGVGKTTTAATIALQAAMDGRKAIALTIDPARRLANALGLEAMGNEAHQVVLEGTEGELWAMMLDARSTWDALIFKMAPDPEIRARILSNRIYRYIANSLAGSQEYMATEKLHDIAKSGDYDLIVLDTPPVKNALDFLESPGRLIHFFDERILKWFMAPARRLKRGRRLMMGPRAVVWRLLAAIFGREFLDDLSQFFEDFRGLYQGFVQRHDAVMTLFRDEDTSFVTVFAPNESSVEVAVFFEAELTARGLPRAGFIANQRHHCQVAETDDDDALIAALDSLCEHSNTKARVLARLRMAHRRLTQLSDFEQTLCEQVKATATSPGFFQSVPKLDGQIHDLKALKTIAAHLFTSEPESVGFKVDIST